MFMYEERAGPVSGRKDLKEHFPAICMQVVSDLPYLVWDSPQFAGFSTRAQILVRRDMQKFAVLCSSITNNAVLVWEYTVLWRGIVYLGIMRNLVCEDMHSGMREFTFAHICPPPKCLDGKIGLRRSSRLCTRLSQALKLLCLKYL